MTRFTPTQLADMDPHEIAKQLGIEYSGDVNAIPHGGTFYSTENWDRYGYADCLRFDSYEDLVCVELGTINRADDMDSCFRTIGLSADEVESSFRIHVEIEACLATWGMETLQDFSGDYRVTMGEDWNNVERRLWKHAIGWLYGLETESEKAV